MTSTRNVMAKSDIFFEWSSYATNEKKWHLPKVWHVFLYRYESKFWKFLTGFRTYFIEEVLLPVWSKSFNRCLLRLVYRKLDKNFRLLDCFGRMGKFKELFTGWIRPWNYLFRWTLCIHPEICGICQILGDMELWEY